MPAGTAGDSGLNHGGSYTFGVYRRGKEGVPIVVRVEKKPPSQQTKLAGVIDRLKQILPKR